MTAAACGNRQAVEADYQVVPLPQEISLTAGEAAFTLSPKTRIVASDSAQRSNAELFAGYVRTMAGFTPEITDKAPAGDYIRLRATLDGASPEAYTLTVSEDSIVVDGGSPAGTFYGLQTLRKAIPEAGDHNVVYPAATVSDAPRFAYRGTHLDVSRHFFTADSVKMFIDMLALHNINRLHWHLTDDQGWRLEIKSRPELTNVGSRRSGTMIGTTKDETVRYDSIPYGGYYTQEQVRDIVDYAAARHITIVPEIDLPGHMQAALAAYPELGCTGGPYEVWCRWGISDDVLCAANDSTYALLDDVMKEVTELFPSEYIHIGGDECPKVRWEQCPKCQALIRKLGFKDDKNGTAEQKLQSHVMKHVTDYLAGLGRKVIGWDEILEGNIPEGAVVMSWRGIDGGIAAANSGHDAIMTPHTHLYFDYRQSDNADEPLAPHWAGPTTVATVYGYDPIPAELTPEQAEHIIGVQANIWTEYMPNMRHVQYMAIPRMGALAEVQWSAAPKDYDAFIPRLARLARIYDAEGYNYARHAFEAEATEQAPEEE